MPQEPGYHGSRSCVTEAGPVRANLAEYASTKREEHLPPEPAAGLALVKPLDEVAGQCMGVAPRTRPQKPYGKLRRSGFAGVHACLLSSSGMPLHKLVSALRVTFSARIPSGVM